MWLLKLALVTEERGVTQKKVMEPLPPARVNVNRVGSSPSQMQISRS